MAETKKAAPLAVTYRSTKELIPYARNARTHSEAQVKQIAASIQEFGFTNSVLIDGKKGIIAGHGRVMAAELLDIDKVPTIQLNHLTEAQKRAYIIADNKLALNADWDIELLKIELQDVPADLLDLVGFDDLELAGLLGDFPTPPDAEGETSEQDFWPMFAVKMPQDDLKTLRDLLKGVSDEEASHEYQKLFILLERP